MQYPTIACHEALLLAWINWQKCAIRQETWWKQKAWTIPYPQIKCSLFYSSFSFPQETFGFLVISHNCFYNDKGMESLFMKMEVKIPSPPRERKGHPFLLELNHLWCFFYVAKLWKRKTTNFREKLFIDSYKITGTIPCFLSPPPPTLPLKFQSLIQWTNLNYTIIQQHFEIQMWSF